MRPQSPGWTHFALRLLCRSPRAQRARVSDGAGRRNSPASPAMLWGLERTGTSPIAMIWGSSLAIRRHAAATGRRAGPRPEAIPHPTRPRAERSQFGPHPAPSDAPNEANSGPPDAPNEANVRLSFALDRSRSQAGPRGRSADRIRPGQGSGRRPNPADAFGSPAQGNVPRAGRERTRRPNPSTGPVRRTKPNRKAWARGPRADERGAKGGGWRPSPTSCHGVRQSSLCSLISLMCFPLIALRLRCTAPSSPDAGPFQMSPNPTEGVGR
jgi:hypothetical protein